MSDNRRAGGSLGGGRLVGAAHAVVGNARFFLRARRHARLYRFLRELKVEGASGPRVAILSGRRSEPGIVFLETFVGAALAGRGAQVSVLFDDTKCRYADGMATGSARTAWDYQFRPWLIRRLLDVEHAQMLAPYSRFLSPDDLRQLRLDVRDMIARDRFLYEGIDLWPHIESSLVRYYRSMPSLMTGYPDYADVKAEFALKAAISVLMGRRVIETLRPDIIVTSHGMYASFGPFVEYVRQRPVRFVIYGLTGMRRNAVSFSTAAIPKMSVDDGYFTAHHHEIDAPAAARFAEQFMGGRVSGRTDSLSRVGGPARNDREIDRIAARLDGRKAFGIFPNVMWECESVRLFNNVFATREEWLLRTVAHFLQSGEILIIRAHPAEKSPMMHTSDDVETLLRRHFGESIFQRPNIIFVRPKDAVSSYHLLPHLKAAIVHTGTLGLEFMYLGLPVLFGGNPSFVSQPFATRFRTQDEYFAALSNLDEIRSRQEAHRELMIKYMYYYLNVEFIDLDVFGPLFSYKNGNGDPAPEALVADERMQFIARTILDPQGHFQEYHLRHPRPAASKEDVVPLPS